MSGPKIGGRSRSRVRRLMGPRQTSTAITAIAALIEAAAVLGPALFIGLFALAYSTPASEVPQSAAILVADILVFLALTPAVSGLGWVIAGHRTVGCTVVVLRTSLMAIVIGLLASGWGDSVGLYLTVALLFGTSVASLAGFLLLKLPRSGGARRPKVSPTP